MSTLPYDSSYRISLGGRTDTGTGLSREVGSPTSRLTPLLKTLVRPLGHSSSGEGRGDSGRSRGLGGAVDGVPLHPTRARNFGLGGPRLGSSRWMGDTPGRVQGREETRRLLMYGIACPSGTSPLPFKYNKVRVWTDGSRESDFGTCNLSGGGPDYFTCSPTLRRKIYKSIRDTCIHTYRSPPNTTKRVMSHGTKNVSF